MATAEQTVSAVLESTNKRYVVETGQTENSWFTLYSDGWIEQGGEFKEITTQVVFPKPFTQPPKTIALSQSGPGSSTLGRIAFNATHPTETSMTITATNLQQIEFGAYWFACGY